MSIAGTFRRPRACFSSISASLPTCSNTATRKHSRARSQWQSCSGQVQQRAKSPSGIMEADYRQSSQTLADLFVRSLVLASTCTQHRPVAGPGRDKSGHEMSRRKTQYGHHTIARRHFSAKSSVQHLATAPRPEKDNEAQSGLEYSPISREEYTNLVDTYDQAQQVVSSKPQLLRLAPRLVVTAEAEEKEQEGKSPWLVPPQDAEHAQQLKQFQQILFRPLGRSNLEELWRSYEQMRAPRLRYFDYGQIRRIFRHMSWASVRHISTIKPRYFSLLRECIGEKIPVTRAEWNSAIAYAGWAQFPSSEDLQNAAEVWLQMERSGIEADSVTFGILFNTAIKAGCYALADNIYQDVIDRGLPLDRYFRTSLIYYAGLRASGDDVRQAFRDLVSAGEIVDTVIMNCVIASLVRAGEPSAAEQVFAKMKQLHEDKLGIEAHVDWQDRKHSGRQLRFAAAILRERRQEHEQSFFGGIFSTEEDRERVQRRSPISPDSKTYRILIEHHTTTSGQLPSALGLIAEMKERGLEVPGTIYLALFRGFATHGGVFHNDWNRQNLEIVWRNFVQASTGSLPPVSDDESSFASLDPPESETQRLEEVTDTLSAVESPGAPEKAVYFTGPIAGHILRAYYGCAGNDRMQQIWLEMQEHWPDMDERARESLQTYVERTAMRESAYVD